MAGFLPKVLLVEGKEDQAAIASLMSAHIPWGDSPRKWPVYVKDCDGIEPILAEGAISLELKAAGVEAVGVTIDANERFEGRWQRIRNECAGTFPDVPADLPPEGLICRNTAGLHFGVWIMPDNHSEGMLETFLGYLASGGDKRLWQYAREARSEARKHGAPYKDPHRDKADIRTWLAWQDPPGQSFGTALLRKCLDPRSPVAANYVAWFRRLFRV